MKRPPRDEEPLLRHSTEGGNVQTLALSVDNYNPSVLALMAEMDRRPLHGYRLLVDRRSPDRVDFVVVLASLNVAVTKNSATVNGGDVLLHTTLLPGCTVSDALIVADLEQCAAIVLLDKVRDIV